MSDRIDQVGPLKLLVRQLIQCGDKLTGCLAARSDREDRRVMIMIGWVAKITKMLRSLLAEVDGQAPENSLIQARVLLETLVNFKFFAQELQNDLNGSVERFWDAMVLQKGKQYRLMAGHPQAAELSQEIRQEAAKAHARAAAKVGDKRGVKEIERQGFYGMNFENRCEATGCKHHYDLIYRPFCDPVHGGDIIDCAIMVLKPVECAAIIQRLIAPTLAIGCDAGNTVFTIVNGLCKGNVDAELEEIRREAKALRAMPAD